MIAMLVIRTFHSARDGNEMLAGRMLRKLLSLNSALMEFHADRLHASSFCTVREGHGFSRATSDATSGLQPLRMPICGPLTPVASAAARANGTSRRLPYRSGHDRILWLFLISSGTLPHLT